MLMATQTSSPLTAVKVAVLSSPASFLLLANDTTTTAKVSSVIAQAIGGNVGYSTDAAAPHKSGPRRHNAKDSSREV